MWVLGLAIRYGLPDEADAIAELVNTDKLPRRTSVGDIARMFSRGKFLVLDRDGSDLESDSTNQNKTSLAGSIFLQIKNGRGELTLLSVAGDIDGPELNKRFIEVAEMMCVAQGCEALELKILERPELHAIGRDLGFEPLPTRAVAASEGVHIAKRL